jgi:hypothetical protein
MIFRLTLSMMWGETEQKSMKSSGLTVWSSGKSVFAEQQGFLVISKI